MNGGLSDGVVARDDVAHLASERAMLSVAIATLNRPLGVARCLDALLSGDCLPAEVLVIDQSDDDETRAVVERSSAASIPVVYVAQCCRGLAASRNAAITHAHHGVLAMTDDDCVPDRGWVASLIETFSAPDAPDAATGRVLPLGPETPGLYAVSSRISSDRMDYSGRAVPWFVGTGGNLTVQREWCARVGGFDERLGAGTSGRAAEDIDIIYRLLRAGARIRYEPNAVVYHERQSLDRRRATRASYGFGIGAFGALTLRGGDPYALRMLATWLLHSGRETARAAARGDWPQARQRATALIGTAQGLLYGIHARPLPRRVDLEGQTPSSTRTT